MSRPASAQMNIDYEGASPQCGAVAPVRREFDAGQSTPSPAIVGTAIWSVATLRRIPAVPEVAFWLAGAAAMLDLRFPTGSLIGNPMWDLPTKLGSAKGRALILVVISVDVAMPILALFPLFLNPLPAVCRVGIQ